jgi:hypothetical protein
MEVDVNYLAVFLAAVASMAVGATWYTPKVFGNYWMKVAKVKMDRKMAASESAVMYGITFLGSLAMAYVLAHVTFLSNDFFGGSFLASAFSTAFWVWLGFIAFRFKVHDMFEGRPAGLTRLTIANELATIMVMALIIGLMGV